MWSEFDGRVLVTFFFAGVAACVFAIASGVWVAGSAAIRWYGTPAAATCHCDPDHCLCCRACTCKEPAK